MNAFVYFVMIIQKQMQLFQIKLQNYQQVLNLISQCSFSSSSREDNNTPTIKNIHAKIIATIDVFKFILFLTNGCIIAKTKKAMPKLIKPFPSSFKPFINLIMKDYSRKEENNG